MAAEEQPASPIKGLIEGFYGRPWTWDDRIAVARFCADRGMTHYVYAPKDDPKHRARWRELYGPMKLVGFDRLISDGGLQVGFGISPGLDIDFGSRADRKALFVKVDQIVDLGVTLVLLALDDIEFDPTAGPAHAALATDLVEHLAGRAELAMVPTAYVGVEASPYLTALAAGVPSQVTIGWTGRSVVNDSITADDARRRAEALGGRRPLLWDNYPVNDTLMSDRLFLGPLWGRGPDLLAECSGYLSNPMTQPHASLLPLASIAAWLRGEDPLNAWAEEAGPQRVFAEACDGAVPQALVLDLMAEADGPAWAQAAEPLAQWLRSAAKCSAPGLENEVGDWLTQVHREAKLGLAALRLLSATKPHVVVDSDGIGRMTTPQPDLAVAEAFGLAARWPAVRRGTHTVMGPRCSFRPVLDQLTSGGWRVARSSFETDGNAIDHLVTVALDALSALPDPDLPTEVFAGGEAVAVGSDGTFQVPPGSDLLTVSSTTRTAQKAPCAQPLTPSGGN